MCHKIRCDWESWKLFGFQSELNKAQIENIESVGDVTSEAALKWNVKYVPQEDIHRSNISPAG